MDENILDSACRVGQQFGLDVGGFWKMPVEIADIEKHAMKDRSGSAR
jgi:hypothetical protein